MGEMMNAFHDGAQTLGIPFMRVADYLSMPRPARWTVHLRFALLVTLLDLK